MSELQKDGCVALEHNNVWSATHSVNGDIYVFGTWDQIEAQDPPIVVLLDSDRDGELDGVDLVLADSWDTSIYGDYTQY